MWNPRGSRVITSYSIHYTKLYEVLIAGELHHAPDYIAELRELARGLNVKFLGYVGNTRVLLALVKKADFFIFPSETEGMSIMLLEATSTGTPAICSNIPENIAIFTNDRITSYNVCYTKLLRVHSPDASPVFPLLWEAYATSISPSKNESP